MVKTKHQLYYKKDEITNELSSYSLNKDVDFRSHGYYYRNTYDFVLKEGAQITTSNLSPDEFKIINKAIGKRNLKSPKHCFYNSQVLAMNDRTNLIEYWEGYVMRNNFLFLHGFNVINSKIIDLTLIHDFKPILGLIPNYMQYMGVHFPIKLAIDRLTTGKNCTAFIENYSEGYPVLRVKKT